MALTRLTNLQTLLDWRQRQDDIVHSAIDAIRLTHPDWNEDDLTMTTIDARSLGIKCEFCDCPTMLVESYANDEVRICREIFSLLKKKSILHDSTYYLCYH